MAYTVKQVREIFPAIQFAGGIGILHHDGKNVEMGRAAGEGEFIPSIAGKLLLESANTSTSSPEPVKKAKKAKVEAVQEPEPELDLEDL
jgi:hypothetical protein